MRELGCFSMMSPPCAACIIASMRGQGKHLRSGAIGPRPGVRQWTLATRSQTQSRYGRPMLTEELLVSQRSLVYDRLRQLGGRNQADRPKQIGLLNSWQEQDEDTQDSHLRRAAGALAQAGRHILAQHDEQSIIVYQAYRPYRCGWCTRRSRNVFWQFGSRFSTSTGSLLRRLRRPTIRCGLHPEGTGRPLSARRASDCSGTRTMILQAANWSARPSSLACVGTPLLTTANRRRWGSWTSLRSLRSSG
jgi:hypothetical protein